MINTEEAGGKKSEEEDPGLKRISKLGRYSMRSNTPNRTADRSQTPKRRACAARGNELYNREVACPVKCVPLRRVVPKVNKFVP